MDTQATLRPWCVHKFILSTWNSLKATDTKKGCFPEKQLINNCIGGRCGGCVRVDAPLQPILNPLWPLSKSAEVKKWLEGLRQSPLLLYQFVWFSVAKWQRLGNIDHRKISISQLVAKVVSPEIIFCLNITSLLLCLHDPPLDAHAVIASGIPVGLNYGPLQWPHFNLTCLSNSCVCNYSDSGNPEG